MKPFAVGKCTLTVVMLVLIAACCVQDSAGSVDTTVDCGANADGKFKIRKISQPMSTST